MHETDQTATTIVTYTHEPVRFGPLLSESRSGTEFYHHYDALGSTTLLTNDAGIVTDTFAYDAWGTLFSRMGSTSTPFQWVGQLGYQYDLLTGCYYVRARSYQPQVARWTSADPLFIASQRQYNYSHLNPISQYDPTGLWPAPLTITPVRSPKLKRPACMRPCHGLSLIWMIEAKGTKFITIVQHLETPHSLTFCEKQDDGCCVSGKSCAQSHDFYEFLGVITTDEDVVSNRDKIYTDYVIDNWDTVEVKPFCTQRGIYSDRGEVRGFADNDLTIYQEIFNRQNGWKSDDIIEWKCPVQATEIGWNKRGAAPAWWNQNQYQGVSQQTSVFDCCFTGINLAVVASNSSPPTVLNRCGVGAL